MTPAALAGTYLELRALVAALFASPAGRSWLRRCVRAGRARDAQHLEAEDLAHDVARWLLEHEVDETAPLGEVVEHAILDVLAMQPSAGRWLDGSRRDGEVRKGLAAAA